jgi:hypothetical protein
MSECSARGLPDIGRKRHAIYPIEKDSMLHGSSGPHADDQRGKPGCEPGCPITTAGRIGAGSVTVEHWYAVTLAVYLIYL